MFPQVNELLGVRHQQTKNLLVHNIESGHQGLPSQGITVLASCQYLPIARRPDAIPDRTNQEHPQETPDAPVPRWQLTAPGATEVRPPVAANY